MMTRNQRREQVLTMILMVVSIAALTQMAMNGTFAEPASWIWDNTVLPVLRFLVGIL